MFSLRVFDVKFFFSHIFLLQGKLSIFQGNNLRLRHPNSVMKLIPALCIILLMLSISCKKSNDQPNTPPSVTDTTKPVVVKVDTSTLLKSMLDYFYDVSGTIITDSSLVEWKYDDQRRIVQQSLKVGTHIDTVFYTYLSDRYTTDDHSYNSGSLEGDVHTVYYQHVHNRTDSAITNSGNSTYYYYNQAGQDSLIRQIIGTTSLYPTLFTINYYYTGQNLDSTILRQNGIRSSVAFYTNENVTGTKVYSLDANNVLISATQMVYTNISSGGLYIYSGASALKSGGTFFNVSTGVTAVETDSYQFDAANRVTVWTINENQPYYQKYLVTWY